MPTNYGYGQQNWTEFEFKVCPVKLLTFADLSKPQRPERKPVKRKPAKKQTPRKRQGK